MFKQQDERYQIPIDPVELARVTNSNLDYSSDDELDEPTMIP
jgi:hypothetical protein